MIKGPKLSPAQWKLLASVFSNMSQAVILFSLAALFVPETVGLSRTFSRPTSLLFLMGGLTLLCIAVILARKERK